MALWYYQKPPEAADPSERMVADRLQTLGDDWIIRWGWYYASKGGRSGADENREGDFLIYGPGGQVLVLEVKGMAVRSFVLNGYWEGDENKDPISQLLAEWNAAIEKLRNAAGGGLMPTVHKALAFPNLSLLPTDKPGGELAKHAVLGPRQLDEFPDWWTKNVVSKTHYKDCKEGRQLFLKAFAEGLQPMQMKLFIRDTERLFARFKETEWGWLQRLSGNRQLLVHGGPGTGKTFMALKTAAAFAEEGEGNAVLILCYNLALGNVLTDLAGRIKLKRGSLTVRTWEAFARDCFADAGFAMPPPPADPAGRTAYYEEEVPGYLFLAHQEGQISARYDALVVDEGQDIDTRFVDSACADPDTSGWWEILFASLRQRTSARMAVFFDPAQRPRFRHDWFAIDRLAACLSQPAHVRLDQAVRFTRPLFHYLKRMAGDPCHPLFSGLQPHRSAPAGPEPLEVAIAPPHDDPAARATATAAAIEKILSEWKNSGLCKPSEVILLGPRRKLADASIGSLESIAHHTLLTYPMPGSSADATDSPESPRDGLRYLSINRSKGLDFLAVIIIDIPDPAADLDTFLFAATRAKQLLGIVRG